MPYSLINRRVLVTGGSRGLGALLATCFAAEGCDVAINYLSSKGAAEKVLAEVQAKGRKGVLIQGDAGVKKDCTRMVEETVKNLGGIDLILANAVRILYAFVGLMGSGDRGQKWKMQGRGHAKLHR